MEKEPRALEENLAFHPYNVMLFFLLFGLTFLFLALTASYIYIRVTMNVPPVRLPWLFWLNTTLLLGSSYTLMQAKKAYKNDDTVGYQRQLKRTIGLSLFFLLMQGAAWVWLFKVNQISMQSSTTAGFLYVLSIAHFAHVVAGLPFLLAFYRTARKQMVEPITVLLYFSDPEKRLKLRLLTIYWHFLDLLWIYLVLFLTANWLI